MKLMSWHEQVFLHINLFFQLVHSQSFSLSRDTSDTEVEKELWDVQLWSWKPLKIISRAQTLGWEHLSLLSRFTLSSLFRLTSRTRDLVPFQFGHRWLPVLLLQPVLERPDLQSKPCWFRLVWTWLEVGETSVRQTVAGETTLRSRTWVRPAEGRVCSNSEVTRVTVVMSKAMFMSPVSTEKDCSSSPGVKLRFVFFTCTTDTVAA